MFDLSSGGKWLQWAVCVASRRDGNNMDGPRDSNYMRCNGEAAPGGARDPPLRVSGRAGMSAAGPLADILTMSARELTGVPRACARTRKTESGGRQRTAAEHSSLPATMREETRV